jgi:uncharacterized protein YuzE
MRLEYDPKYNVAYIRFLGGPAEDLQTLHVSEELNIDMTPDGHIYGIELLNANEQLFRQDAGKLVVENRQSGTLETVRLVEEA